jgi:putative transposase
MKTFTHEELMRLYCLGRMVFADSWRDPKLEQARKELAKSTGVKDLTDSARRKLAYVTAVLSCPKTLGVIAEVIKDTATTLKDSEPPHPATVLDWRRDYESSGNDPLSLIDRHSSKGRRPAAIHPDTHTAIETAIQTTFLQRTQNSLKHTLDIAQALVQEKNKVTLEDGKSEDSLIPSPTFYQVRQRVTHLDAYYRDMRRKGRDEAERLHRSTKGHYEVRGPLHLAEMDHGTIDAIVICERTFIPLGRPTSSVLLDVDTRSLLGLHTSFDRPSYRSVAHCVKHALLPKMDVHFNEVNIINPWFAYGAMYRLSIDNGPEFHSDEFEALCFANDVDLVYAKRKTGWHKPHIERFISTMAHDFVQTLPGTTFSNIIAKGDYNPKKTAILPLSLFKALQYKWVCDVYHTTPHSSTGLAPMTAWANRIAPEDIPMLSAPLDMTPFIGYREPSCVASENGIQHKNLQYNSPSLRNLRARYGDKITVETRWDSADLGYIYVIHPNEPEPIKVPALDIDYASGLSLYQHERIQAYTRQVLRQEDSKSTRLQAKLEIARKVQEAMERAGRGGTFKSGGLCVKVDVGRYTHGADGTGSGFLDPENAATVGASSATSMVTGGEPTVTALPGPSANGSSLVQMESKPQPPRKPKRFDPIYNGQVLTENNDETHS